MNPQTIVQLIAATTQLVLLVNELQQGVITQNQAWATQQADFQQAVAAWNAAVAKLAPAPAQPATVA